MASTLIPVTSITSTGVSVPPYSEVLAGVQALFQSIYGSDIYLTPDSQDGQLIAALASAFNDTNLLAQAVYQSFSPTYAQGAGLSSLVKINGLERESSSNSTAIGTVVGVAGTTINNGVVSDINSNLWNLPPLVQIPYTGSISVTVTAQEVGDITAIPGAISGIHTPTLGWQSFVNTTNAIAGNPVETDSQLRQRQAVSTGLPALTVIEALNGVIANLSGVSRLQIYENYTNTTNAIGIPGNSICVVVQGGSATAIAQAIWSKKTPGCNTFGTTSEQVTDSYGNATTINFDSLLQAPLTLSVTLQPLAGYLATTGTLIQEVLAAYINNLGIGEYSFLNKLWGPANLDGDIATSTTGMTQQQLDALSATYNVLGITQSRASNPSYATSGAGSSGANTLTLATVADIYAGQSISVVTASGAETLIVQSVNYTTGAITFIPALQANVTSGAAVSLLSDIVVAYNEACEGLTSNITLNTVA